MGGILSQHQVEDLEQFFNDADTNSVSWLIPLDYN